MRNVVPCLLFLTFLENYEIIASDGKGLYGLGGGPANKLVYHPYGYGGFDRYSETRLRKTIHSDQIESTIPHTLNLAFLTE